MGQLKTRDPSIYLPEFKPTPYQSTKMSKCFHVMNVKNGATNATSAPGILHPWPMEEISNNREGHNHLGPHKIQEGAVDHNKVGSQTE